MKRISADVLFLQGFISVIFPLSAAVDVKKIVTQSLPVGRQAGKAQRIDFDSSLRLCFFARKKINLPLRQTLTLFIADLGEKTRRFFDFQRVYQRYFSFLDQREKKE